MAAQEVTVTTLRAGTSSLQVQRADVGWRFDAGSVGVTTDRDAARVIHVSALGDNGLSPLGCAALNRVRALLICTHPTDYAPTRVREAAKHLLAQSNITEEESNSRTTR